VSEALPEETAALVRVSAAIAARAPERLAEALAAAAGVVPPEALDEAILQSHLFVGFPITLEAMRLRAGQRSGEAGTALEEVTDFRARGERICATVYGRSYPRLRESVAALHPELDRWMVEEGYGRVLGRPGLDLATRELCVVALLVVWDAPRQLHSHLLGARNAGATDAGIRAAVEIACGLLDDERAGRARGLLEEVLLRGG
jgi:4-carboxymuconolactone decarboxylase